MNKFQSSLIGLLSVIMICMVFFGANTNTWAQNAGLDRGPSVSTFILAPLDPSLAGEVNTFTATGATPGGDVTFIWGFEQGFFDGSSLCNQKFAVGIRNFVNLTTI